MLITTEVEAINNKPQASSVPIVKLFFFLSVKRLTGKKYGDLCDITAALVCTRRRRREVTSTDLLHKIKFFCGLI